MRSVAAFLTGAIIFTMCLLIIGWTVENMALASEYVQWKFGIDERNASLLLSMSIGAPGAGILALMLFNWMKGDESNESDK